MALTKTPFFGLGSKGSVGGFLTSQKRGSATLLREKPVPTDPYTLPQAYQRWLYEDYAYLWTQQSGLTCAEYRAAGSRHHLTGFQYWMKYQLTHLPDYIAWYKLDEGAGAIAHDSARNLAHGTIFGCSPASGIIGNCFSFDGLNDYVDCGDHPFFTLADGFTLRAWINCTAVDGDTIIAKDQAGQREFHFHLDANLDILALDNTLGGHRGRRSTTHGKAALNGTGWRRLAATYDGGGLVSSFMLIVDGQKVDNLDYTAGAFSTIRDTSSPLTIGKHWNAAFWEGLLDDVRLNNRVLSLTELQIDAARAYYLN